MGSCTKILIYYDDNNFDLLNSDSNSGFFADSAPADLSCFATKPAMRFSTASFIQVGKSLFETGVSKVKGFQNFTARHKERNGPRGICLKKFFLQAVAGFLCIWQVC
jgi:hypothetical protein